MGLENRDERLKKFERSQIKTPQQQTEALQKAQAEIGSLTNERQALLKQQQSTLMGYQQQLGALQGQATALSQTQQQQQPQVNQVAAMNSQTQAILQKYGVNPRKPQANGSKVIQQKPIFKSTVAGGGTTNVRTENKTIYNTKTNNSVQVIQPQGIAIQKPNIQIAKPAIQLRNQISQQLQFQNQQYELSKKNFLKSDISLRKGADMMMRKIDAASKRFAENMNPQKLAASSIDSTKVIMTLAIAYLGIKFIGPISRKLDKLYFWFTGESEEGNKEGGGYNKHMGFFDRLKAMVDTNKDDSLASKIITFFKDGFKDIKGYLELVFEDRAMAVAAVKSPGDREKWGDMSFWGMKYIPAYLADIFKALLGGTKGVAQQQTRQKTKALEEEGKDEVLKATGLPSDSFLNGAEGQGLKALLTKGGYYSNQYMDRLTSGGVIKDSSGKYSVAQIQAQHEIVRKNITNPLGSGSTYVSTEYARYLGGSQIDVFNDDRTKQFLTRKKLKSINLLPFKLLQFSNKDWKTNDVLVKISSWLSRIPQPAMVALGIPLAVIQSIVSFIKGEDTEDREKKRKAYEDIYKELVKLLDKKADKGEKDGWQKEIRSIDQYDNWFAQFITGSYYYQFEVYFFPVEEENEVKSSIDNLIKSIAEKHNITGVFNQIDYSETKDVTKVDKGLFDVIKEVYDIKEFNTSDINAYNYYRSIPQANYTRRAGVVDQYGQDIYQQSGTRQVEYTDDQAFSEAQQPVQAAQDYDRKVRNWWMEREVNSAALNSDFVKGIRGVASKVSDAITDFRTDDSIEKSSKAIESIVNHLSDSLGISKDAAIGIVSNLWAESGIKPTALGDYNTSLGIAQWHYKEGIQRVIDDIEKISGIKLKTKDKGNLLEVDTQDPSWKKLQEFAKDDSNYRKLLLGQLQLLTDDLKNANPSSKYGRLYQQLLRSNNPLSAEDASEKFVRDYENPGEIEEQVKKRRDYASQIKRYLGHQQEKKEDQERAEAIAERQAKIEEERAKIEKAEAEAKDAPPPLIAAPKEQEESQPQESSQPGPVKSNTALNMMFGGSQYSNISIINNQVDYNYNSVSS